MGQQGHQSTFLQAQVMLLTSAELLCLSLWSGSEIASFFLLSCVCAGTTVPGAVRGTWEERRSHGLSPDNGGWVSSFAATSITLFYSLFTANTTFINVLLGNKVTFLQLVQTRSGENYSPHLIIHPMAQGLYSSFDRGEKKQWIIAPHKPFAKIYKRIT